MFLRKHSKSGGLITKQIQEENNYLNVQGESSMRGVPLFYKNIALAMQAFRDAVKWWPVPL